MELIKFIQNNNNWREILSKTPYCLDIKEDENYVLFKYSQIDSDFKEQIVKEARGIIFRKIDMCPVCIPFWKFFNFGEPEAATIDWNSARVESKEDGSLIKMWFDDCRWHISTNGTICADKANIPTGETFDDLFISTLADAIGDINNWKKTLSPNLTYLFELCHPLTRVVVHHKKGIIYHIGTRDNTTFKELTVDIGIPKPRQFSFNSLLDVIAMAEVLPYSEEGYVIVDKNWNRVKVKSPSYVAMNHLKNNGVVTYKRLLTLVLKNEQQELIIVFPEFTKYVNKTVETYNNFIQNISTDIEKIRKIKFDNRKEYAMLVTKTKLPDFFFSVLDKKYKWEDLHKYLKELGPERLTKILGLKDEKVEKEKIVIDI